MIEVVETTPTGSNNVARGQRRSRATPGRLWMKSRTPMGFHNTGHSVCKPFWVGVINLPIPGRRVPPSRSAFQGLSSETALRLCQTGVPRRNSSRQVSRRREINHIPESRRFDSSRRLLFSFRTQQPSQQRIASALADRHRRSFAISFRCPQNARESARSCSPGNSQLGRRRQRR